MKICEIRNVMVVLNSLDASQAHVIYAAELARRLGSSMLLVHFVERRFGGVFSKNAEFPFVRTEDRLSDSPELIILKQEVQKQHGVAVNSSTYAGSTPTDIIHAATLHCADVLVLETFKKKTLVNWMLGPTEYRVAVTSTIPVFCIPRDTKIVTFDRVVIPFHASSNSRENFSLALMMVQFLKATVMLLAFSRSKDDPRNMALLRSGDILMRRLSTEGLSATLRLQSGSSYAFEIECFSNKNRASLIVISAIDSTGGLFRRDSKNLKALLQNTGIPVLSYLPL